MPGLPVGSVKHHTGIVIPICPEERMEAERDHDCPRSQTYTGPAADSVL